VLVGQIVVAAAKTNKDIPGPVIASALAVICGSIILFLGLARLGFIVELISLVSISAFMTGSAINIAVGQLPTLMGITGFDTRAATYKVFINFLKGLPRTKLDAAIGLTALFLLYAIRSATAFGAKKYPAKQKLFFFLATLRTAFVILLYTLISWLVNRHHRGNKGKNALFKILGPVPRGMEKLFPVFVSSSLHRK
jgi:sodium-independent sulfate anion transporter 11